MSNELLGYAKTIVQLLKTAEELEIKDDERAAEVYKIAQDYVKQLLGKLNEIVGNDKESEKE
ncbi:hypothetical protein J5U23_02886 [Saccharolobus shibatae B12]|uniref:Uncharacterized protein n=1 Tax=Saccharolobus shibatae (strain ATCC 51178 / DSM 5389 / JCM 8931 / NBRC 15437 / B12) TaxID=523848 RepID=A0A8F5BR91_SACSH|nr:hypothetical protein [Saccharolobus shibatae]QXJ27104.1 hypothetical protein J5U23_p2886 [Saccharolobus shibatae B12]QXJ29997.1 hypothetical protein J5U23_02886 [Saccharolobus shibatae B12]